MRTESDIRNDKRVQVEKRGSDGFQGWLFIRGQCLFFVCSWGGGWDHVSVSLHRRCPTWEEMCVVKEIFFTDDECCVEYHPAKKDYVNVFPYCLHIWKPQAETLPTPPKIFV